MPTPTRRRVVSHRGRGTPNINEDRLDYILPLTSNNTNQGPWQYFGDNSQATDVAALGDAWANADALTFSNGSYWLPFQVTNPYLVYENEVLPGLRRVRTDDLDARLTGDDRILRGAGPNGTDLLIETPATSAYDVLMWSIEGDTTLGFINDSYWARENAPQFSGNSVNSYTRNVQLTVGGAYKLTHIIILDYTAPVHLEGTAGNDSLTDNSGIGRAIFGGAGNDSLAGLSHNDCLVGGDGNDTLDGGTGTDQLVGGAGNDVYIVDNVGDRIFEFPNTYAGTGIDTVSSSVTWDLSKFSQVPVSQSAYGMSPYNSTEPEITGLDYLVLTGSDAINGTGNELSNYLFGNSANNQLSGLAGNDWLAGGLGNDTLIGGEGVDTLIGGGGDDVYYADLSDSITEDLNGGQDRVIAPDLINLDIRLFGNLEDLELTGNSATYAYGNDLANRIVGNAGNNDLAGFAGNDVLSGGLGNDRLMGGFGSDTLTGGEGADFFVFNTPNEGIDVLTDFNWTQEDKLYLSASGFRANLYLDPFSQFEYNRSTGDISFAGSWFARLPSNLNGDRWLGFDPRQDIVFF